MPFQIMLYVNTQWVHSVYCISRVPRNYITEAFPGCPYRFLSKFYGEVLHFLRTWKSWMLASNLHFFCLSIFTFLNSCESSKRMIPWWIYDSLSGVDQEPIFQSCSFWSDSKTNSNGSMCAPKLAHLATHTWIFVSKRIWLQCLKTKIL